MSKSDELLIIRCPNEKCNKVIYKAGAELDGRVEIKCRGCKGVYVINHHKSGV